MLYLIICILASAGMTLLFKVFEIKKIDNLQAILANYLTASLCCNLACKDQPIITTAFWQNEWFVFTILLGIFFIVIFYAMAMTAQKIAVSVSIVASKMSLVITLFFLYFYYNEAMNIYKWLAVGGALFAVYLTTKREEKTNLQGNWSYIFPLMVFIGSGIIDSSLKYLEITYFKTADVNAPLGMIFFFAGCTGLCIFTFSQFQERKPLQLKSILGGVCLGLLNYTSTYTLLKTLSDKILSDSVIFPIINIFIHKQLISKNNCLNPHGCSCKKTGSCGWRRRTAGREGILVIFRAESDQASNQQELFLCLHIARRPFARPSGLQPRDACGLVNKLDFCAESARAGV
ncbi:MAG: hypothetical protein HYZ42_09965, partial [Bacteroidetes bacterium]|nr:hypothetical protein [Bacteroidota bacterium]